jgi:hypothetical protein
MTLKRLAMTGLVIGTIAGSFPVDAHHSYAQYDACVDFTLTGEVTSISWANPHVVLVVDADDGVSYRIEWGSIVQLRQGGVTDDALAVGDELSILGSRNKDPEKRIVTLLREVRRVSDDWSWRRNRSPNRQRPAACEQ